MIGRLKPWLIVSTSSLTWNLLCYYVVGGAKLLQGMVFPQLDPLEEITATILTVSLYNIRIV